MILNPHAEELADMYRIEISPGEETVLRTIEELATAIRNGLVTPRSRVYHNASQKWLPIEFHPHYKKALALPERPKSAPVSTPLPSLVPNFAIKRESAPAPEPPAPTPPPPVSVAEAPRPPRPSLPIPAAAENLPFIEVEMPPRMPPAPPAAAAPPPPPRPMPAPVSVTPPLPAVTPEPATPEPALALAADAFPSLVQPRSYLPPELEQEPMRSNPLAEPAPPMPAPPMPVPPMPVPPMPVPPMPVASRRASGGRPILVGGGALAFVVVGYLFLTSGPSSQVVAESVPAAEPQKPAPAEEDDYPAEDTDLPVPRASAVTTAPPRSGPPSQAWSSSSGATAPLLPTGPARQPVTGASEAGVDPAPAIAPPPVNVELAVPKLPGSDSLAPKAQRDTAAIKRILKAVGGQ